MAQVGNYLRGVQEAGGPVFQVGGRGPPGSEVQPGQDPQVNEEHQSPPTPLLLSSPVKPEDSCWSLRAVCTDYNSPCFYVWKYTCRRTNKRNLECITKSCCFESCQADTTVELRGFASYPRCMGKAKRVFEFFQSVKWRCCGACWVARTPAQLRSLQPRPSVVIC